MARRQYARHTDQRLTKRLDEALDAVVQERTYDFARFGLTAEGEALRCLPGLPPTLALPITMKHWRPGYVLYPAATENPFWGLSASADRGKKG